MIPAALLLVAGLASSGIAAEAQDLRGDVPSGAALRQRLADLSQERAVLARRLAVLAPELAAAIEERSGLGETLAWLATEIEELRSSTTQLAVSSFVSGGPGTEVGHLLELEAMTEASRRWHLFRTLTRPLDERIRRLRELESGADAGLIAIVERLEAVRPEISAAEQRLSEVSVAEAQAASLLVVADAWDRADRAIAEGDYGVAPRNKWEALRHCESTDDYGAVSSSGRYRGAYQFDFATWQTTGGIGDPAAASPAEQDARARELYALRGHRPWPVCGRHLR